jgi:hypothetical protein
VDWRYPYDQSGYGAVSLVDVPQVPLGHKELLLLTDTDYKSRPIVHKNPVQVVQDNWQVPVVALITLGFVVAFKGPSR